VELAEKKGRNRRFSRPAAKRIFRLEEVKEEVKSWIDEVSIEKGRVKKEAQKNIPTSNMINVDI
jgi:hypothetical protein